MAKFYLTTPLYYVNAKPHIGHSYTEIAADALARYHRQKLGSENVLFLTGTDEHGQKIDKAAQAAGLDPQAFADRISQTFRQLWKTLEISYDDFIRTTEMRHKQTVRLVWEAMRTATVDVGGKPENVLYRHTYDGFYCVSCETFITPGVIDPADPTVCPDCKKPLEAMKEETYFFRTSAYQSRLIADIESGKLKILPEGRRNEVLGFLKNNTLTDLSVSRPKARLAWGIPIPFDAEHVTYVWFDALVNYISAVGFGRDRAQFDKWWPADVHIIGKDILKHHAVLWPTFLYALGIPLPELIFAHGWWVQGGAKMSKSLGNVTDPVEIVEKFGVDPFRYFLLRETPFGQDGTFSEEALTTRYNTDLANDLGNLLHRTLTMCEKYFGGDVPDVPLSGASAELAALADALPATLDGEMKVLRFDLALAAIWSVISAANRHIEVSAPWTLAKEQRTDELRQVIGCLHRVLCRVADAVAPFMPGTASRMRAQLGTRRVAKGEPLFMRIENQEEKAKRP